MGHAAEAAADQDHVFVQMHQPRSKLEMCIQMQQQQQQKKIGPKFLTHNK